MFDLGGNWVRRDMLHVASYFDFFARGLIDIANEG